MAPDLHPCAGSVGPTGGPSLAARDTHSHLGHSALVEGPLLPAGAVEVLMSTLEVCEANEALRDVGDSGGFPGEGRALLFLCCFVLGFDSRGQAANSALRPLCASPGSHPLSYWDTICPLFGSVYHKPGR